MSFFSQLTQNVQVDANNSSTANINASASWGGTATSTLGIVGIQVSLKTDQNCTVYVQQAPNNSLITGKGTVTTAGTTTLTGSGTEFTRIFHKGDVLTVSGETSRTISAIASDTSLTVTVAFSNSAAGLSFEHYPWDIVDTYNFYAALGNFGVTVQAVNSYLRVIVVNLSTTSATTYFRLQTALCPIVEAVPRSLNESGRFITEASLIDEYGFTVENTPMGELRTITPVRLVGANFEGTTLDTNFWTSSVVGTGTVTQANSEVTLTTTTGINGGSRLNSLRRSRYVSGVGMRYRAVIQLGDTGTVNNKRRWGIAWGTTMPTITDGCYFELNGSVFSVVVNKGGSETRISSGSFNGSNGSDYILSTNVKTYEIYWTNSYVYFVINGLIIHSFYASTTTWSNTMNHHIYSDNINSGGSVANVTLKIRVASISRLGLLQTSPTSRRVTTATTAVLKYGLGQLHRIVINDPTTGTLMTIYDNTAGSGTIIAIVNLGTKAVSPVSIEYNLPFNNGLTIVSTGTWDATIVYE